MAKQTSKKFSSVIFLVFTNKIYDVGSSLLTLSKNSTS